MSRSEDTSGGAQVHALRWGDADEDADAAAELWAPDLSLGGDGAGLDDATAEMLRDWQAWKSARN